MVIPPLYELQGRRPVSFKAGAIFVIAPIGSAVTSNFAGLLVTRVLAGTFSAVFPTMVGSVMRELSGTAERNGPMVLFFSGESMWSRIGPMVLSIVVHHVSWRWFTICSLRAVGLWFWGLLSFLDETRGSGTLSKKATTLNKACDRPEKVGMQGQLKIIQPEFDQSEGYIMRIRLLESER